MRKITIFTTSTIFLFSACSFAQADFEPGKKVKTSFYQHGSRTASGEKFNPNGLTAAHRTLPFGTRLKLVNPSNGRAVTVRVNDRGPFIAGRGLDVSRGAAAALGMLGSGVAMLQVTQLR